MPSPVRRLERAGASIRVFHTAADACRAAADQVAAAQVGQQRARNIQDNINVYGRPYGALGVGFGYGFGYGLGLSGGTLYNYPY